MAMNRRDFMRTSAGVAGALAAGSIPMIPKFQDPATVAASLPTLPSPEQSGIEHIVVVMMENRSFDHFLGWLPGGNGMQAGLSYRDASGVVHSTYPLAPDFTGCPHPDPDHSYSGGRVEYNNGAMDGFLRAGSNDVFSIGYYSEQDLAFYSQFARNFTTCSRYHAAILGPTFPNRIFAHAAQTDRLDDSVLPTSLPTIWDNLINAGVSCKYYFNNLPVLALWLLKYVGISWIYTDFLLDVALGTLPHVSFIDPYFTVLDDGTGNDDHPHADIRRGDAFLAQIYHVLSRSRLWKNTALVVNFDEWGGFFEHLAPPRVIAANSVDTDIVDGKTLLGFRLPTVVASPWSYGNPASPRVDPLLYDHTAVLKLIEWRYNLPPLTPRDGPSSEINNLAYALDFTLPHVSPPSLPRPSAPAPVFCGAGGIFNSSAQGPVPYERPYQKLANSGLLNGWKLPNGVRTGPVRPE